MGESSPYGGKIFFSAATGAWALNRTRMRCAHTYRRTRSRKRCPARSWARSWARWIRCSRISPRRNAAGWSASGPISRSGCHLQGQRVQRRGAAAAERHRRTITSSRPPGGQPAPGAHRLHAARMHVAPGGVASRPPSRGPRAPGCNPYGVALTAHVRDHAHAHVTLAPARAFFNRYCNGAEKPMRALRARELGRFNYFLMDFIHVVRWQILPLSHARAKQMKLKNW